jgi:hypothetical protein
MPKTTPIPALSYEEFTDELNRPLVDKQVEYALYLNSIKGVATAQMFYLINRLRSDYAKNPEPGRADPMEKIRQLVESNDRMARLILDGRE